MSKLTEAGSPGSRSPPPLSWPSDASTAAASGGACIGVGLRRGPGSIGVGFLSGRRPRHEAASSFLVPWEAWAMGSAEKATAWDTMIRLNMSWGRDVVRCDGSGKM